MMAAAVADMPAPVLGGLPAAATAAATLPRMTDGVLGAIGRATAVRSDEARRHMRLARLRDVAEAGDSLRFLSRRLERAASFWSRRGMFRTAAAGGVAKSLDASCVAASMIIGHRRIALWKPMENDSLSTTQPRPANPGTALDASPRYLLWLPAARPAAKVGSVCSMQRRRGIGKCEGPADGAAALP